MAVDGALTVAGAAELVAPIEAWIASLDPRETASVLFTFDTHLPHAGSLRPAPSQSTACVGLLDGKT